MIGTDIAEDGGVDKGVEGETDVCSKIQDRDKDGQTSDEDPAFKKRDSPMMRQMNCYYFLGLIQKQRANPN